MSLFGALSSGVSGLSAQSSALGAIADNVTNVNTIGYKSTDVQFQTLVTAQVSSTKYSRAILLLVQPHSQSRYYNPSS